MKKNVKSFTLSVSLAAAIIFSNVGLCAETMLKPQKRQAKPSTAITKPAETFNYETVDPLDLVANPQNYIKHKIKFTAQFAQFSTLGLDYPPINKSSKDYISFLIKRPDAARKDYNIPFSELKLIIKRDKAEKLIDLESGDKIEVMGTVFSTALGDPWVDVDQVKILDAKPNSKKKADSILK